jgi:hypothetical protein
MKRPLLLLSALSAALVFGGSASAVTEITFLYGLGGELGKAIESTIKDFNASQKDVVVRGEFANTYEGVVQKALAGIAAGQPAADILQLEVAYVPRIADAGALLNLNTLPGFQKTFDNLWPVFQRQVGRPDGSVYAMPWNNSNPVLYYNPTLLKKAGLNVPPRTYTELREAAKKIKAATGVTAIALPSFPWVLEGAIWSNGGEVIQNGRLALDQPRAREVIEHWAGFFRDGSAVLQDANTNANFAAGKVAMVMNSVASRTSPVLQEAGGSGGRRDPRHQPQRFQGSPRRGLALHVVAGAASAAAYLDQEEQLCAGDPRHDGTARLPHVCGEPSGSGPGLPPAAFRAAAPLQRRVRAGHPGDHQGLRPHLFAKRAGRSHPARPGAAYRPAVQVI